jgi:hypothetical protein
MLHWAAAALVVLNFTKLYIAYTQLTTLAAIMLATAAIVLL